MHVPARWLAPAPALVALYGAALALPFRVFFSRFDTHLIGNHGDALLQHLHCAWQWLALADGRFAELLALPTMHPYSSGFVFGETLLGITLPLAPLPLLGATSAATFNTAVLLSFLLLGVSVFLWVRELFDSTAAGLFAAVLVVFTPWRVHYLSNLNNLTIHYAVFGMWLLSRWLRRAELASLLGAALLFYVQLLTTAQVALSAIYLCAVWLLVVWAGAPRRFDARRAVQLLIASACFAALCAPWLGFFREAFDATPGLLRTSEMHSYSAPFPQMARLFGGFGPLGVAAAAGAVALVAGSRRRLLTPGNARCLLGLTAGAAALFVIARGPFVGPETDPTPLPGYYAARFLPLLDAIRAPIRLAAMTPVYLALLAGGGFALALRWVQQRISPHRMPAISVLSLLLPLTMTALWPALPPAMAAPISQRAQDRSLAEALAALPPSSVILPLPLDPEPGGAAVDERVLIHRRQQIGGFASILAEPFRQARLQLGQWPDGGHAAAHALGASHVVVPSRWLERHAAALRREGYDLVDSQADHAILAMPPAAPAEPARYRVEVPPLAAANRWLTLSISPAPGSRSVLYRHGHRSLSARWHGDVGSSRVRAHAFLPGIGGPDEPIRVHVPTPSETGSYRLWIDNPWSPVDAPVEIRKLPTSLDAAVADVSLRVVDAPEQVRAGEPFRIQVELRSGAVAPILLATSRCTLPERCGEVRLSYQFRQRSLRLAPGLVASGVAPARSALARDLTPGDVQRPTWALRAPPRPGRYTVRVRLGALGAKTEMDWTLLIRDLDVRID